MPVERRPISASQLAELLGEDPIRLLAIERVSTGFVIVTEPSDDTDDRHVSATERQHDSQEATERRQEVRHVNKNWGKNMPKTGKTGKAGKKMGCY